MLFSKMLRFIKVFFFVTLFIVLQSGYSQNQSEFRSMVVRKFSSDTTSNSTSYCSDTQASELSFEMVPGYLSRYLETLRIQNCSQFLQECRTQVYASTQFSKLVYLRFCNRSQLEERCFDEIHKIVQPNNPQTTWRNLIQGLNNRRIDNENLVSPCLQVATLDKASLTNGYFHEVMATVPFCSLVWCGFDEDTFIGKEITLWNCIASR